jgi:hypothetical protein
MVGRLLPSNRCPLLKEAGIPQAVVMELFGHDSEQMSQHYTHARSKVLKRRHAVRGVRLISVESLLNYLNRLNGEEVVS